MPSDEVCVRCGVRPACTADPLTTLVAIDVLSNQPVCVTCAGSPPRGKKQKAVATEEGIRFLEGPEIVAWQGARNG